MALTNTLTTAARGFLATPTSFVAIDGLSVAVATSPSAGVTAAASAINVTVSPPSIIASGA